MSGKVAQCEVTVQWPEGLHMRVASEFATCAKGFRCDIRVNKGTLTVNGKGILDLLTLAAQYQDKLLVEAEGEDAEEAVSAISGLLALGAAARSEGTPS